MRCVVSPRSVRIWRIGGTQLVVCVGLLQCHDNLNRSWQRLQLSTSRRPPLCAVIILEATNLYIFLSLNSINPCELFFFAQLHRTTHAEQISCDAYQPQRPGS